MKGLITFAVIAGVIVIAGYYGMGYMLTADQGQMLAFACGNPNEGTVEVQVVVPIALPRRDPPRTQIVGDNVVELWDEWIAEHFVVYSGTDEPIVLKRRHNANLIPEHKVGTPDSYLHGRLEVGKEYTFDFTPQISEGKKYRYLFTTSENGPTFSRQIFELVE